MSKNLNDLILNKSDSIDIKDCYFQIITIIPCWFYIVISKFVYHKIIGFYL